VQQQLISLQSFRQALLRVQSERLSQRTTLHLVLGGSFEHPLEPTSEEPMASSDPPKDMDGAAAVAE
jgi:hypothetical protein